MVATVTLARIGRLGGRFPITNLGDLDLQNAASYAIRQLEARANKPVRVSISRITSAEYQVSNI